VILAGGTGGAILAAGLAAELPPGDLTVVANTGDDRDMYGVSISPDFDMTVYRLAGLFDEERRFGIRGDTFGAMDMLGRLGQQTWFGLGDRDLAFCLARTRLLRVGMSPAAAARELCERLQLPALVLPMSDQPVRTLIETPAGELDIQEWFVRERQQPEVLGVRFAGVEKAMPAPGLVEAFAAADLVVIGPSNPAISVDPILAVIGHLLDPAKTVAVSPIVGGEALKGPTVGMLRSLGREPTPTGVAAGYQRFASGFVLDARDRGLARAIEAMGLRVHVTDTVMRGVDGRRRLARDLIEGAPS